MNRFPPEPLNDEERALATLIARDGPHGELSPALDAKILAAAHSAVAGRTAKRKPRWPVFTGAAASVLLAAGIGWQMLAERDQTAVLGEAPAHAPAAAAVEPALPQADSAAAPEVAPSPSIAPPPPPSPPPRVVAKARPAVAPEQAPATDAAATAQSVTAEPAFAPPTPAVIAAPAAAQRKAMRAEQRAADAREAAPMMQSAPAPAAAEAAVMADSVSLRDIPVEADVQLPERDWLQRIEQRLAHGDRDGARASLRRFAEKYPQTELPPELRALLDE